MKRPTIPEQRAVLVAAAVAATPGRTREELAAQLGISIPNIRAALLIASRAGAAKNVWFAQGLSRWYPPDQVPAAYAVACEASRQALASKRQRCAEWKRAGKPARVKVQRLDPGDEPIIRRHVDVAAPLPFVLQAPRSVFELGGAA